MATDLTTDKLTRLVHALQVEERNHRSGVLGDRRQVADLLYAAAVALLDAAEREAAARKRVAGLEAALRPFAAYRGSDEYLQSAVNDEGWCKAVSFKAGDYRAARAALSPRTEQEQGG